MPNARHLADEVTAAVASQDIDAVARCYAASAVLTAPEGVFKGRQQIAEYFRDWFVPFSELRVDVGTKAAWGNQALDEWSLSCTNTGELRLPTGERLPATGKRITVRGADVCIVDGDAIVEHHLYYDQVELLGQLGLLPE